MTVLRLTLAAITLAAATSACGSAVWEFEGDATNAQSEPLYTEHHTVSGRCQNALWVPESDTVSYNHPDDGSAFASKSVDYAVSPLRPTFDFRQPAYHDHMIVTNRNDDRVTIEWTTGKDTQRFTTDINPDVVIDAGFDNLVRRHWQQLNNGQSVDFRFLGPTRGEHYGFVLEPTHSEHVQADLTLQIRPTGMVTRFLVDPIILGYNRRGELTDYYGLTNIHDTADSNYTAHIRYRSLQTPNCPFVP